MAGTIRAFIAVEIPSGVRQDLSTAITQLKKHRGDVKWVRPESMHLTLKFLGDVRKEQFADIESALKTALEWLSPFQVQIGGTGAFPNLKQPRVFWVGLQTGAEVLTKAAARIEDAFASLGFPKEKRAYSPHLTLGRVRSMHQIDQVSQAVSVLKIASEPFTVNRVVLMQSDLKPTGAEYTPVFHIQF